ncbi:hypothetical protein TELCIR_04553, partial [Teladorsagia circumcincta]
LLTSIKFSEKKIQRNKANEFLPPSNVTRKRVALPQFVSAQVYTDFRNDLVVLVDESFTSCVFGSTNFRSFLTYRHRVMKPENVFYLWSLSKDFGIPGMKISVVQSSCPKLLKSLSRLELIHPVSALAHDAAIALLSDFGEMVFCLCSLCL